MKQKRIPDTRFGQRLKMLRIEQQLTGAELCDRFNKRYDAKLNASTISRYENATQEPMLNTVALLADFFGVSPVYLMGQSDDRHASLSVMSDTTPQKTELSDEEAEIIRIFRKLNTRHRHELLQLAFELEEKEGKS